MSVKTLVKKVLPYSIQEKIKEALREIRFLRNLFRAKVADEKLVKEDLSRALRELGIKRGDTLILHSSLSRIGMVEGGGGNSR
jgi:hypothetical protein